MLVQKKEAKQSIKSYRPVLLFQLFEKIIERHL